MAASMFTVAPSLCCKVSSFGRIRSPFLEHHKSIGQLYPCGASLSFARFRRLTCEQLPSASCTLFLSTLCTYYVVHPLSWLNGVTGDPKRQIWVMAIAIAR